MTPGRDGFVFCNVRWPSNEPGWPHTCTVNKPGHTEHRCCCGQDCPPDSSTPTAEAARIVESFRVQRPMNGDGSNYTIDRILTALVGAEERDRLKREHQDRWNEEHLAFRARVDQEAHHG
jgi:hypothetical protein